MNNDASPMNEATAVEDLIVGATSRHLAVRIWTPNADDGAAPILLYHDSLGCIAMWRDFPEMLAVATGRKVIAYDRLGFGQSDPYPGLLDPSFVAAEGEESVPLLQRVCGFGAFIAWGMAVEAAARHAAQCAGLVTLGAQAFVEDLTVQGIQDARGDLETETGIAKLAKYHGDKAEWVLRAWVDTWLSSAFKDWSLADALAGVTCPVLAIHGAQDEYGSRKHAEMIAGRAGQAMILDNCGHFPHREATLIVIESIQRMFSST